MVARRKYFKLPSNAVIEKMANETLCFDQRGAVARTKQIYRLFGPPRSMLFAGTLTADAYFEMIRAYIFGLYISTIHAAHTVVESGLSFGYILISEDEIAEGGLAKLAAVAFAEGNISKYLFEEINELRLMRIACFHSHVGLNPRSAMKRYLDKRAFGTKLHRKDAAHALKIVYDFLNEGKASE